MIEDYLYWIWLNGLKGIGPVTARRLLNNFMTPENIYNATIDEIMALEDIRDKIGEVIIKSKDLDSSKRIIEKCEKQNIGIVTYEEKKFPSGIKSYSNMPILLYYKGNLYEDTSGVMPSPQNFPKRNRLISAGASIYLNPSQLFINNSISLGTTEKLSLNYVYNLLHNML